jgi:hypothetical protein
MSKPKRVSKLKQFTLTAIINTRLKKIGASKIPPVARKYIEEDVMAACAALIERRVTAPYIGKMVARALAAPAATPEGSKGEQGSPLASSARERSEQGRVAGLTDDPAKNNRASPPKGAS